MEKKHIIILLSALCAILAAGTGAVVLLTRTPSSRETACAENVARLQEMETADISSIEKQLNELKKQDQSTATATLLEEGGILSDVEIKQAFQGSVIIGDSITESIVEYGFLDTDVVVSKRGLSIVNADEQIQTAIGLHPSTIFMAFGSNDLEIYESDSASFIDAYRTQLQKLSEALPDSPVYINGILPILQSTIDEVPALGYYPQFNQALQELCMEMGYTYIDTAYLVNDGESMYEPDGEHVIRDYYPKWLTLMAKTAGL
ncbi:MAG: GDSL-type esterase/lipase family protein [Eubacteriales bacterium]|nr:GDSL-type esterase/lipase family protein [Eubacteriales bacterium]